MFYVIDKRSKSLVKIAIDAKGVAAFLLGMRLSDLVIIKSDEKGDRLYTPTTGDCFVIQQELEVL